MQNNHVYVDDDKRGTVTIYDDDGKVSPERKFTYSNSSNRSDARKKAEAFAASEAGRIGCGWGCNYEGRRV